MTLRVAVIAVAALLLIALSPIPVDEPAGPALKKARRTLFRGVVTAICPTCCQIMDEQGQTVEVALLSATVVAGEPTPGDQVDVLAELSDTGPVAVSIVKTRSV